MYIYTVTVYFSQYMMTMTIFLEVMRASDAKLSSDFTMAHMFTICVWHLPRAQYHV